MFDFFLNDGLDGIEVDDDLDLNDMDGGGVSDDYFNINSGATGSYFSDDNGDGLIDSIYTDTNGDGIFDNIQSDLNGDGIIDSISTDTNGDGIFDNIQSDLNGDGIIDSISTDTNGDGIFDSSYSDLDGDGVVDYYQYSNAIDTDGDGINDTYVQSVPLDTDGDGILDSMQFNIDQNMDGAFEINAVVDSQGNVSFIDNVIENQSQMPYDEQSLNEMACNNAANMEHFDANDVDTDDIIGSPEDAMQGYHVQETGTSCAVAAQEFALEQLTGRDYTETELRELAEENGWYSPEGGTSMEDVGKIMESQGLTVQSDQGNSLDDIANCLNNDGAVVVGVDVYELYGIEHDYGPGMGANHAVQVTGIDYSDPESPMVILNDSSNPDGCGVMIPAEDFMNAWEDSDCFMVEAYS